MRRPRRKSLSGQEAEPGNLTPLIDIVFQLLVFFMLTMQFRAVEGKLLSQLPKIGPQGLPVPDPPSSEVRIVFCADGDTDAHITGTEAHIKGVKDGTVCSVLVDRRPIGSVHRSETRPSEARGNREVYRRMAAMARDHRDAQAALGGGEEVRVVLDADREVPYEHVIGAVNACKARGIVDVEFTANPLLEKYYRD